MNNMTDIIEQYINKLFQDADEDFITLKRSNVAEKFDCVPSQLNYVIKTRFTPEQGFIIESKRGGGGFIRITKITLHENIDYLDYLINNIESEDLYKIDYNKILKILKNDGYINHFDFVIMTSAIESFNETHLQLITSEQVEQDMVESINYTIYKNKKDMMIKFLNTIKYNKENS